MPNNRVILRPKVLHTYKLQRHLRGLEEELTGRKPSIEVASVCPAWVSTNIIPSDPLARGFMGFMAHSMSSGVRSSLCAAFLPAEGVTSRSKEMEHSNSNSNSNSNHFISNAGVGRYLPTMVLQILTQTGLRGMFFNMLAPSLLLAQRVSYGCFDDLSSPESYDLALQDALWDWSLEVLSPWRLSGTA
mmetsp:Transcript_44496/g.60832  ORF Transcript_44496/g.60832 Transcript_44496/m.60832 type:complete len:188 (-) Transcript_44496:105-668(-)